MNKDNWTKVEVIRGILSLVVAVMVAIKLLPGLPPPQPEFDWELEVYPGVCVLRISNVGQVSVRNVFVQSQTPGRQGAVGVLGTPIEIGFPPTEKSVSLTLGIITRGDNVSVYWRAPNCPPGDHVNVKVLDPL